MDLRRRQEYVAACQPATEPPGGGNRRRIMAYVPEQNVVLMENYVNPQQKVAGVDREQQIWTYRVGNAPSRKRLPAPQGVALSISDKGASLHWKEVPGATRYVVTRWQGESPLSVKSGDLEPVMTTQMSLLSIERGVKAAFTVRAEGVGGAGESSVRVRTQPALVEDVIASVRSATEVKIAWPRPTGNESLAYHIERAVVDVYSDDEIDRLRKDTPPLAEPSVGAIKAIRPFQQI